MNPVEALRDVAPPYLVRWLATRHSSVVDTLEGAVSAYVDTVEKALGKLGRVNSAGLQRPRDSANFVHTLRMIREDAAAFVPPSLASMERLNWVGGSEHTLGFDWQKAPEGSIWRWALEIRMARSRAANELATAERRAHMEATAPERALEARREKIRKLRTAWHAALFKALAKHGLTPDYASAVLEYADPRFRQGSFEKRVAFGASFVAENKDKPYIERVPLTRHELPR